MELAIKIDSVIDSEVLLYRSPWVLSMPDPTVKAKNYTDCLDQLSDDDKQLVITKAEQEVNIINDRVIGKMGHYLLGGV